MALFKRKQHSSHIQIRLAPRSNDYHFYTSPDHYLSNETINGCAVVKLAHGAEFSHSKVTLKGHIKATVEDPHTGAMGKQWRTESLPFLGVVVNMAGRNAVKGDDGSVRIPFRFDLSKCEQLTSFISELPPSLDSHLEGKKSSECQYEISYTIAATAFSPKSALATTTHKIFVLPVCPDALSAEHSEAPNEYHWAELHSLTKHPRIARFNSTSSSESVSESEARIEIAGQEPEAIVFDPETPTPDGTTEVPFVIKWCPRKEEAAPDVPARCNVKAHLVTKTHITPDGLQQIGSQLEFMRTGGNHVTRLAAGFHHESSIDITGWEKCESASIEPFSVARFSFPYTIHHDHPPVPTFFTPLLSRRYFLDLSLTFPERPHEAFHLSLPVEVAHGIADAGSDVERKASRDSTPEVMAAAAAAARL